MWKDGFPPGFNFSQRGLAFISKVFTYNPQSTGGLWSLWDWMQIWEFMCAISWGECQKVSSNSRFVTWKKFRKVQCRELLTTNTCWQFLTWPLNFSTVMSDRDFLDYRVLPLAQCCIYYEGDFRMEPGWSKNFPSAWVVAFRYKFSIVKQICRLLCYFGVPSPWPTPPSLCLICKGGSHSTQLSFCGD